MKGNPGVPGGSLKIKPTWSNTSGCSTTSAFSWRRGAVKTTRPRSMLKANALYFLQMPLIAVPRMNGSSDLTYCQFAEYLYRLERILIRPVEAG